MVEVVVDEADAGELEGRAAGLHADQGVGLAELLDHVGVVRGEGVGRPVLAAVALAVVGVVARGRDDPLAPPQPLEAHVEGLLAALVARARGAVHGAPPDALRGRGVRLYDQERPVGVRPPVVLLVEQVHAPVAAAVAVGEEAQPGADVAREPPRHGAGHVDLLPPRPGVVQGQGRGRFREVAELLKRKRRGQQHQKQRDNKLTTILLVRTNPTRAEVVLPR